MLREITSAPPALTADELSALSASTPASFAGIPPLLRHKQEDVYWTIEPAYEGLSQAKGTLWVTEECLSFLPDDGTTGVSIPYENITLHALSKAPLPSLASMMTSEDAGASSSTATTAGARRHTNGNGAPHGSEDAPTSGPCVYCQINEFEDEGADDYDKSWEVMIIPSDGEASVEQIFEAMSKCASMHPPTTASASTGGAGPQIAGLDMDSLVYADADGNVHGPESFDDAPLGGVGGGGGDAGEEAEQEESAVGAQRSDYVADTRRKPY